jgi:hypothetical protein
MSVNWDSSATVMMLEQLETPDSYVPGGPTGSTTLAGAVRYVTTLKAEDRLRAAIVVAEHAGTSKTLLEVADIEGLAARRDFPDNQMPTLRLQEVKGTDGEAQPNSEPHKHE